MNYKYCSQHGQDKYVIERLNYKRNGFFVDVGAAHPTHLSNTYVLESQFDWNGILIEPNDEFLIQLQNQRKSTIIKALIFNIEDLDMEYVLTDKIGSGYGDHIKGFGTPYAVKLGITKLLKTTKLQTILEENNAPKQIDYINIDVEGAELEVLQSVDLKKYSFSIMSIEGNNKVDNICRYLIEYGYIIETMLPNQEIIMVNQQLI